MTDLQKFYIARLLGSVYFWITVAIPYYLYRGLNIETALALMGFYSIMILLLEYPTGVIGDHYGHKFSIILGSVVTFVSMIVLVFDSTLAVYVLGAFLLALGNSLISGSDEALLKSISNDFKKDLRHLAAAKDFVLMLVAYIAGVMAVYSFELTLYLTGITSLIAVFFLLSIKSDYRSRSDEHPGDIFATAFESLKFVKSSGLILALLFLFSVVSGYGTSVKTLWGTFSDVFSLNVDMIGVLVALGLFIRLMGKFWSHKFDRVNTYLLLVTIILSLLSAAFVGGVVATTIGLLVVNFLIGIVIIRLSINLNDQVPDSIRASILSLKSLMMSLFRSGYLFIVGIILAEYSFNIVLAMTAIITMVAISIYFYVLQKSRKLTQRAVD